MRAELVEEEGGKGLAVDPGFSRDSLALRRIARRPKASCATEAGASRGKSGQNGFQLWREEGDDDDDVDDVVGGSRERG